MSENTFISQPIYAQYLQALLSGERELCSKIVQECSAHNTPLKDLYVDLFQRSMSQVGDLWEQQRISVAAEHLATEVPGNSLKHNDSPSLF
jgi:methanogenic corrinoid protein MtbC1